MNIRDYIENKRVTIKPISFFILKKHLEIVDYQLRLI